MPRTPNHLRPTREKVFGEARGIPLDRNAKVRIMVYARGYNARYRQRGQHHGPITRAFMEVLETLLWGFHNAKDGRCFPSYESLAKRAECNRDTVYEAIKALEFANVLSWVNRIVRIRTRERDLFGQWAYRWRIIRTSNAYAFRDPLPCHEGRPSLRRSSTSENPTGTINPDIFLLTAPEPLAVRAAQEALARFRQLREPLLGQAERAKGRATVV
jgi:Helix-turn-helix domain